MKQLKMMRFSEPALERVLPEGYTYEFYNGSDERIKDRLEICAHELMGDSRVEAFHACLTNFPDCNPTKDTFFMVDPSGLTVERIDDDE